MSLSLAASASLLAATCWAVVAVEETFRSAKEAQAKKAEDLVKAKEDLAAAEADGAKALNLQIGDTSDDFNHSRPWGR